MSVGDGDLPVDDTPKTTSTESAVPSEKENFVAVELSQEKSNTGSADGSAAPAAPAPGGALDPKELAKKLMAVFAVSSALAIFLWFMAGAGFPWFIYIVYAVGLIDCIVYGAKQKDWFFVDWTFYASTNVMLFLTFLACGGGYPWFICPAFSMAVIPVSHYICRHYQGAVRWLYIHAAIYLLINTMIFFIWMINSRHNAFPWFIYPWCGWGILVLIQYNVAVMHDTAKLFIFITSDIACMLLITFRFAIGPLFLVFVFVALVVGIMYYVLLKKGYTIRCSGFSCLRKKPAVQDPAAAQASSQPPAAPSVTVQVPVPQPLPTQNIPQNIPQLSPQGYQTIPAPHPMFYPQQQMYFQPQQGVVPNANGVPMYYAYFPNGQHLYPTLYTGAPADAANVAPVSSAPISVPPANNNNDVSSGAVLVSESKEKDNEEEHLLRNSPTRSYSKQ